MTQAQAVEYIDKIKQTSMTLMTSKKEAREFLAKAGICTKKGDLKKEYR